jgi:hypothetical protein
MGPVNLFELSFLALKTNCVAGGVITGSTYDYQCDMLEQKQVAVFAYIKY